MLSLFDRTDRAMIVSRLRVDRTLYLLLIPGIAFYLVFRYWPMYGVLIAFKEFSIPRGILGSRWAGLKYFRKFFETPEAWALIRNTLMINLYQLLFAFPAPIILASLFNELRHVVFKRTVQTVSYLPHFISTVIIAGMVVNFLSPSSGIVNVFLTRVVGLEKPVFFMAEPRWFRAIYVASDIWQGVGWGTIIYLAALAGVNPELYEAARIDGAGRWQQYWNVTFVALIPITVMMLILRIGQMMQLGPEKVILLYNPLIYETADIISTYVYRRGLLQADYSYAAAVDLFQSAIGFVLVVMANRVARATTEGGLW